MSRLSKKEQKIIQEQEAARIAEEKRIARREELMQMSEKELLVEMVLSLEEHNSRLKNIEMVTGIKTGLAGYASLDGSNTILNTINHNMQ